MKSSSYYPVLILTLPVILFLLIFFLTPAVSVLWSTFYTPETGFTLKLYWQFFSDPYFLKIYWRTIKIAGIVTLLALLCCYPTSYYISRLPGKRKALLMSLVILPLMTNAVARTYAWLVILGRFGTINNILKALGLIDRPIKLLYTEGAVVVGLAQLFMPLMVLSLVSAMENIRPEVIQAARSLGASHLKTFFKVIVPLSKEGLLIGGTLVFTGSVTAFVTPWLMGGTRVMTLSTLLRQKAIVSLDWNTATVVAVVMFTTTIIVNLILKRIH
ncbi:ABC transporter permease subunit [candidate division KSB3 bacterium]|uniref:ABC transporter permease subunit n=1 Tax=candidate division KSB3 bacterium TaxID=2044937 RepID=A0A9D5Q574_9BACT|nr:ABC transporter permease subunit [candidate division KSB3 bacterium]MBD3324524.1 ABC transporter permease subunit [candidate division KSB3 bacterium]